MNCTDLLSHLGDYFDEQLSAALRDELQAHTASCQHCRVFANLFTKLKGELVVEVVGKMAQ